MYGLLTVEEAAEILKVTPETIRRRIRSGEIKAIGGGHRRRWLIPHEQILEQPDLIALAIEVRRTAQHLQEKARQLEIALLSLQK